MTALKPIEYRNIKGISATKYKVNDICSVPGCNRTRGDKGHHIFPRSQIGNDSYFVLVGMGDTNFTIPHVTGLCSEHHTQVEIHDAWIKLEDDLFVWYEREKPANRETSSKNFIKVGPLDPQPGVRVKGASGSPKKKREKNKGEKKRNRRTLAFSVPNDAIEDGAGIIDDLLREAKKEYGVGNTEEERLKTPDYNIYVLALYNLVRGGA